MTRRSGISAAAALVAAAALIGGCAGSAPADAPDWYLEHLQSPEANEYPRLEDVPQSANVNLNEEYWAREAAELTAAGAAVKAHPRSEPAGDDDAAEFEDAARAEIEATRASH